jgi:enoyl-CoA hydratase
MANQAPLLTKREGPVAWVSFNRPDALNAINDGIREQLPLILADLDRESEVRVIVLNSSQLRSFSVGADIKEAPRSTPELQTGRGVSKGSWIESIAEVSKPVIASIAGYCLGGGLEMALACDIRIASPDASFALPEINLGLLPGGGGTQRLPSVVGLGRALDMMLTGERLNATRAYDIGLITRLSSSAETLFEETRDFANMLAAKSSTAAKLLKQSTLRGMDLQLAEGLRLERDLFGRLRHSPDSAEAAAAFTEKRAAAFHGAAMAQQRQEN